MSQLACEFTGVNGEKVALKEVSVSSVLRDLLAEVTVSQSYQNQEQKNIEAVYTFPLPLDAVLLDLDIVIGNRHLKGAVVEKRAAETKYEDAVESGDAAVMLEEPEPGMYTMNVGNLLPRENVTITLPLFPASQMDGRPLSTSRANDDRFKVRRLASSASSDTRIKPFRRE